MRRISGGRRPGFTLIELVVALVVVGVIALAAHAAVGTAAGAVDRLERATDPVRRGAAVRAALGTWLGAIAPVGPLPTLRGVDNGSGPLAEDEIVFTIRDGGILRPGPHRIRIGMDADPRTPVRGLIVQIEKLAVPRASGATILEAATTATGFSVRYLARVAGHVEWHDHWNAGDGLPVAIRLRIFGPAPSSNTAFPDLLRMPVFVRLPGEMP